MRAVDTAGNKDPVFDEGRNAHSWEYIPALPWGAIIAGIIGFLALVAGAIIEWRRRRKKAAMERYAIKRMRRKFKVSRSVGAEVAAAAVNPCCHSAGCVLGRPAALIDCNAALLCASDTVTTAILLPSRAFKRANVPRT